MTSKIFNSILIVAVSVLLSSLLIVMGVLYVYFGDIQKEGLSQELDLASISVSENGKDYLKKVSSGKFRLTWINSDGTVIYDTDAKGADIENHADREEFKEALSSGKGESTRYSSTLTEKTAYCAKRLDDGTVLRISTSYATILSLLLGISQPIIIIIFAALIFSVLLARRLSRKIVEPLNNLDLDEPLKEDTYEELSPLLNRINRQHKEIKKQLCRLQQKTDEFEQITRSMNEGLVLLDKKGFVLSINPAAKKIFDVHGDFSGEDFLKIDRSHKLNLAITRALEDGHSELRIERGECEYQLDISRIESSGEILGAVILAFDITQQAFAEKTRREFTANVSHELKTPLQGIIGSAELIENNMVKKEDVPHFIKRIHTEAQRLVALIEDIIRLSQLDEGDELMREDVNLLDVARDTCVSLENAAAAKNVKMTLSGSDVTVYGVRRLLCEIIYNLCDNAIKYNKDGGTVKIDVSKSGQNAVVSVSDNGIGIPKSSQSRVFERFYRVDKSHSKASGGTGLGLSIVKHAVSYHHGKIDLKSSPQKGTTITVTLPLKNTES